MAYKADSKIICEMMKSKFGPLVVYRNIGISYRFHHVMCGQETGKARKWSNINADDLVQTRLLWRGFRQGMLNHVIAFKLMNPWNPCRYVFKCFSSTPSRSDLSGDNNQIVKPDERGKDAKVMFMIPERNLNEIAFKQKQNLKAGTQTNSYRMKMPSRTGFWGISTSEGTPSLKHQFVESPSTCGEISFTDNLSVVDEDLKNKLKNVTPSSRSKQTAGPRQSADSTLTTEQVLQITKAAKTRFTEEEPQTIFTGAGSIFMKQEGDKPGDISKERPVDIFRKKHKIPSEPPTSEVKLQKPELKPLPIFSIAKPKKVASALRPVSADSAQKLKSFRPYNNPYNPPKRSVGEFRPTPYVNPELISASNFYNRPRTPDLMQKFRIKRDLISVISHSTRLPIINRRATKIMSKSTPEVKLEFTPLPKSHVLPVKKSKRLTSKIKGNTPVNTWNFMPKKYRARFGKSFGNSVGKDHETIISEESFGSRASSKYDSHIFVPSPPARRAHAVRP